MMAIVVFVILAAFMTWSRPCGGVSVDLPLEIHPIAMRRAMRWDAMVIMTTRDGKVFLKSDSTPPGRLPQLIRKCVEEGAERKVYLNVDRLARYGDVLTVLAEVRSAGIENVGFLVRQSQPPEAGSRH
jgi:biopolymer transport protein ExbD